MSVANEAPLPQVSVVIPAYRRRDSVLLLLDDLFRQDHPNFEVIVVEDCGDDGTAEAVESRFPRAIVLRNEKNSGPAVSRNRGVRVARSELIVGFDSDVTLPETDLLSRVVATFVGRPEATGLAFRLLKPDGKSEDAPRWWHPLPITQFATQWFETSYFSGTAYAFRRNAMMAAGLFPELLYMHYEEVELAWRIIDGGGAIFHASELRVIHHANPVSRRSQVEVFLKPRNQILLAASCLPPLRLLAYVIPRTGFQLLKALGKGHAADFFRAMGSAARILPQQIARRRPLKGDAFRRIRGMRRKATLS